MHCQHQNKLTNNKKDLIMANIVEFTNAVKAHLRRSRSNCDKHQRAAEQAVVKGRAALQALAILLESQHISPVTTTIKFRRNGQQASVSLLEVIRGAEVAFNELEQVNE
jgi:hypothetical protein